VYPTAINIYDIGVDLLSGVGVVYLLVTEPRLVGQRRFLFGTTVGIFVYVLAEPLSLWYPRWVTHGMHGLGLLFIGIGVARPVLQEIHDDQWATLLVKRPESIRPRAEWMTPLDDEIMNLFHSTTLVLSPTVIAYNIDYSRDEVNRRLSTLTEHGLLERVERGKYRLTNRGEHYFYGDSTAATSDGRSGAVQAK